MAEAASLPRVFLDISIATEPVGRLVIELFTDKTPKTCENFRTICTGSKDGLTYKMSPFHRVIDEFMIQGGDITKGNGTGGASIYGGEFEDENIGWRDIDQEGLDAFNRIGVLITTNRFFITLAPCPHINAKHTVFGQLVSGQDTLERIAKITVDKNDKPLQDVVISTCVVLSWRVLLLEGAIIAGVHIPHPVPVRLHHPEDTRAAQSRAIDTDIDQNRRRSDASPDHNLRGRIRQRSRSQSPIAERESTNDDRERKRRKRSPPPSRPQSRSRSTEYRRQRSLPNQYRDWRDDGRSARRDRNREGDRYRNDESSGRLGDGEDFDDFGTTGGVKYKGRGHMKFSERDLQPRQQQGSRRY
ncbi:Proline isomerase domain containing protein [Venturia nashicola]|nr:Proline isomerase domain containing protein [Venturia nashicola]